MKRLELNAKLGTVGRLVKRIVAKTCKYFVLAVSRNRMEEAVNLMSAHTLKPVKDQEIKIKFFYIAYKDE